MATKKAKEALERAQSHLARATEDKDDADEVFVWGFYALENAVVAAAIHGAAEFGKNHWSKAAAARRLSNKHGLTDVSDLLTDLNDSRKGTAYGDVEEPEIEPVDALQQVTDYVNEVVEFLKKEPTK